VTDLRIPCVIPYRQLQCTHALLTSAKYSLISSHRSNWLAAGMERIKEQSDYTGQQIMAAE
jgi:hypothetical protein